MYHYDHHHHHLPPPLTHQHSSPPPPPPPLGNFINSQDFYPSSPSSSPLPSSFLQRSNSSLSLYQQTTSYHGQPLFDHRPELFDFQAEGAMRRVFSTGDILEPEAAATPPPASIGGVGATAIGGRVGRYNAEERKERIERYRSKRNQRNFQKKITYACRKMLADSRPRVRGRFARNGEPEPEMDMEGGEGGAVLCYNNSGSDGGSSGRWCVWGEIKETSMNNMTAVAAPTEDEEYNCYDDNELNWANLLGDFSMTNIIS